MKKDKKHLKALAMYAKKSRVNYFGNSTMKK